MIAAATCSALYLFGILNCWCFAFCLAAIDQPRTADNHRVNRSTRASVFDMKNLSRVPGYAYRSVFKPMSNSDYKIEDSDSLARLPLDRINAEIARCLYGYQNGGTSQGRKAFFKRLDLLEQVREESHGISAKPRRFNSR